MTTKEINRTKVGVVKDLRKIRDKISQEIMEMTFTEEREYLDKLLSEKKLISIEKDIAQDEIDKKEISK